jgi:hypothetical protein
MCPVKENLGLCGVFSVIHARVVSINTDMAMNMTRDQFFTGLEADDQPVDNWAKVEQVITDVGNTSLLIRKLGFIEVHQATRFIPRHVPQDCSPRFITYEQYETEYPTQSQVFFDRTHMNLVRMAVRTLASTRNNDVLAKGMADHIIHSTTKSSIVRDRNAYIIGQKLIRDKESLVSHTRNVPFYELDKMKDLASIMYQQMSAYEKNETVLMLKLDIALGRMADMNKNFEDARMNRELYFKNSLETLEMIWNSTQSSWIWSFNSSRNLENSIQETLEKNMNESFTMQTNELVEMLAEAEATVEHDKEVKKEFEKEIERYSKEAKKSLESQRNWWNVIREEGIIVQDEGDQLALDIEEWSAEEIAKAALGLIKAIAGMAEGMSTLNPFACSAAAVAGAADIELAEMEILSVFMKIADLIEKLSDMEDMLNEMIPNVEENIPDITSELSLDIANGWRKALESSYEMKDMTSTFEDMDTLGTTLLQGISGVTDNGVIPTDLMAAMHNYALTGGKLVQETVNFGGMMMHLADLAGELEVAKLDLDIAIEQVNRIIEMQADLITQQQNYTEWMNKHRDEYEKECDECTFSPDISNINYKLANSEISRSCEKNIKRVKDARL